MLRRRHRVVVAFLLVLSVLPTVPAAGATLHPVQLAYRASVLDASAGLMRVSLAIRDAGGVVQSFTFTTANTTYPVTNLTVYGATRQDVPGGVQVDPGAGITYVNWTVAVDQQSYGVSTYTSYLSSGWGLIRAEALGLGFATRYDARYNPQWVATLRFDLPTGWTSAGPWPQAADGAYRMPTGEALPAGFVALGSFQPVVRHGAGRTFVYAELGATPSFRGDLFRFLENATPYDMGLYGNVTGPVILAASAPAPMFQGGLAARDSLYVRDDGSLEVLAHEYVHVWQRFITVNQAGRSTLWLNEGDADYNGPLSLEAAGFWTPEQVDQHFRNVEDQATRTGELTRPLNSATYGGPDERVAYDKGALSLNLLDQLLANRTADRVRLADVLRALDARYSPLNPAWANRTDQRVTNADVLHLVVNLTGPALRPPLDRFFASYVNGTKAPAFTTAENGPQVLTEALVLQPPVVLEGHAANATVTVRNRGPAPTNTTVTLFLNTSEVGTRTLTLPPAATRNVTFALPVLHAGTYDVQAAYRNATLHVLAPPALRIADVVVVPGAPTTGSTANAVVSIANDGGAPGSTIVHLVLGGVPHGNRTATVAGGRTTAVSFPLVLDTPGNHTLAVTVSGSDLAPGTTTSLERTLVVRPAPPANPALPKNVHVPGAGAVGALVALAALALMRRRRS